MDPKTFVEMMRNIRRTDKLWTDVYLSGPSGNVHLTYYADSKIYTLFLRAGFERDPIMMISFIGAQTFGSSHVHLIPESGNKVGAPVFDPTRFELDRWMTSRETVKKCSTTVEQREEAMANG